MLIFEREVAYYLSESLSAQRSALRRSNTQLCILLALSKTLMSIILHFL